MFLKDKYYILNIKHTHTIFNSTLQVARLQQILNYKERSREVLHRAITKTKSQDRNFGILYERHEIKITC